MREKYEEVSHLNVSGEDALSGLGIDNDISEDVRNEVMEQLKDVVFKIDISFLLLFRSKQVYCIRFT